MPETELIDQIYEAAVHPELWPAVLNAIAVFSNMRVGCLFAVMPPQTPLDTLVSKWVASPGFREPIDLFLSKGWVHENLRADRLLQSRHSGFLTDRDICTEAEIASHPHYEQLRSSARIGNGAATVVKVPSGDTIVMSWDRWADEEPVGRDTVARLDALRPHLARSSVLAARLGLERASLATSTLEALGLPACILRSDGRILVANEPLVRLMPQLIDQRPNGRLCLTDRKADRLLADAFGAGAREGLASTSIPVRPPEVDEPVVAHLLPLRRSGLDIFTGAAFVLVVTPLARPVPVAEAVLSGLFDLTAAEAAIARSIACGQSLGHIAAERSVSTATVRHQLKAIFAKTGASRQTELAVTIGGISVLRKP